MLLMKTNFRRWIKFLIPVLVLGALIGTGLPVQAQTLSIDWQTVDAGGGTTTGGEFTLQSTIGQSDAGLLLYGPAGSVFPQSGDFMISGGFWGLFTEQAPVHLFHGPLGVYQQWWLDPPQVLVKWPAALGLAGWGLETKTNLLETAWRPVNGATFGVLSNAIDYFYYHSFIPLPPYVAVTHLTNGLGAVTSVTNTVPALQLFRLRQP